MKNQFIIIMKLFLISKIFIPSSTFSQLLPPKTAYPLNIKQIHAGHSLTDPLFSPWPGAYNELLADSNGLADGYEAWGTLTGPATLAGAWIRFHWDTTLTWCGNEPTVNCYEQNMNPRYDIDQWELLVITENMEGPLTLNAHQSREHLSYFVNNSWQNGNNGNGAPTLLWSNWGGLDGSAYFLTGHGFSENPTTFSGWRQQLDSLETGWQAMQDYANANLPAGCPPVYIIPGNRMMARLYDDIQQSIVPGISSINDIFTDGVHLNNIGSYLVTMIHYACIFNKNPMGLSNDLGVISVTPAFATYAQQMVWDVVTNYPRSGIFEQSLVTDYTMESILSMKIYPNPVTDMVIVSFNKPITQAYWEIKDIYGKTVLSGKFIDSYNLLSLGELKTGIYFLYCKNLNVHSIKLVKQIN